MTFTGWPSASITRTGGPEVIATAPLIISASRVSDIPAFHGEWFMRRLRSGWLIRVNPFTGQPVYLSLARMRAAVFWTKYPRPFFPVLPELDRRGITYYFHFTLNDYEEEGLEPSLPVLAERVAAFRELARRIGPERVIWRFDPLILTSRLQVPQLLSRLIRLGDAVAESTRKLVISFVDVARYRSRWGGEAGRFNLREFTPPEMEAAAAGLADWNHRRKLEISACAEDCDLQAWGIRPNRCVDDELLRRLAPGDAVLQNFLTPEVPGRRSGQKPPADGLAGRLAHPLRDRGQRRACGCIVSQDIGRAGTCGFACVYCYARHSPRPVPADVQTQAGDALLPGRPD